jgi:spermidine synthase
VEGSSGEGSPDRGLGAAGAAWLVFFSSGAVLVLEILSLRLVAPYLGLTLETSTAIIGFALAAIAAGAWVGGQLADRVHPSRLLGPALLGAGILVLFVGPAVRWVGGMVRGGDVAAVLLMAAVAVFVPAALLSAITPMVVKLRLATLAETGSVVGQLSGIATLGALVATFTTGFLLVAAIPTSLILMGLGGALILAGAVLVVRMKGLVALAGPLVVALVGVGAAVAAPAPCDVETAYHCARVVPDELRPQGRTLQLDTLSHSFVDLDDPTYLRFSYINAIASIVDGTLPPGPVRALHLGGGGLTFPRYLRATRPGSRNLVFEVDRGVLDLDVEELGLHRDEELSVEIEDARVGLASERSSSRDLIVGDAFGGLTVPWHLATRELVSDVRRVLTPEGLYVLNLIDYPPLRFARAEIATVKDVFPHVVVIARPPVLRGVEGGNIVLAASEVPIPVEDIRQQLATRAPDLDLIAGPVAIDDYVDGAGVLTDDFAPVDQLVTTDPSS